MRVPIRSPLTLPPHITTDLTTSSATYQPTPHPDRQRSDELRRFRIAIALHPNLARSSRTDGTFNRVSVELRSSDGIGGNARAIHAGIDYEYSIVVQVRRSRYFENT